MTNDQPGRVPHKHFLELTPEQFAALDTPFLTLDKTTYAAGDELVLQVKDHREQTILGISKVVREKVNGKWVYLCLTGIDDLVNVLHNNASQEDNSQ